MATGVSTVAKSPAIPCHVGGRGHGTPQMDCWIRAGLVFVIDPIRCSLGGRDGARSAIAYPNRRLSE